MHSDHQDHSDHRDNYDLWSSQSSQSHAAEVHGDLVLVLSSLTSRSCCPWHWPSVCNTHYDSSYNSLQKSNSLSSQLEEQAEAIELANSVLIEVKFFGFFTYLLVARFYFFVADFKGFRQELAVKATNSLWVVQEGKLQEHNLWCKCFIFSFKFYLLSTRVLTSSTWVAVRSQVRSRWCSTKTPPMESRKSTSAAQSTWRGSPSRGCPFICMWKRWGTSLWLQWLAV